MSSRRSCKSGTMLIEPRFFQVLSSRKLTVPAQLLPTSSTSRFGVGCGEGSGGFWQALGVEAEIESTASVAQTSRGQRTGFGVVIREPPCQKNVSVWFLGGYRLP